MKPKEIIELEKKSWFKLVETKNPDDILGWKTPRVYLLDTNKKIIGLNLYFCIIEDVSFLRGFTDLISLNLFNNHLISDISFLQGLTNLKALHLGGNQISDTSFLQDLLNLEYLRLLSNKISDISFLQNLINLKDLNLCYNKISDISFLTRLKNLTSLDLKHNQISIIQQNFLNSFFYLEFLNLRGNPIKNIPKEVFDKEENCLQDLKNYFTELEKGSIINETVKLIIVGNGRVGKTSMFKKLKGLAFDENENYTHGINIGILEKENLPEAKTEKLKLNVWDFGGQEVFYATHQFFMRDDVLYILAWTDEKNVLVYREKDTDVLPNNEPEKWQSCEYWLDTIRRYAKNSPILMVQTHTDCTKTAINETLLKKDYNVTEFLNFSASKSFGLEELKNAITQHLNSLTMYGQEFPKTYENVILEIENRKNENVISYSEFVNTICRNANISEGGENSLLSYLDSTGLVVHYEKYEKLQDKIYINPEWLTKQVYSLINNKLDDDKIKGKISLDYLKENLPNYEKFELIELFKKFELLFEVQDRNETFWISPQYLPENLENNKVFQSQFDMASLKLIFRFATFMPDNVMINFLSRYGSFAKDEYWKNGIYFTKYYSNCIVVRENATDLYVYAFINQDNNKLLQEVCNAFVEFGKNAKTEISVNQKDFVVYTECKDNFERKAKEIKSLQGEILQMKDFWFLFGKQKNTTNMHFSQHIKKALTAIENASIAVYFDAMNEVISNPKVRREDKTSLNRFEKRFISGDKGFEFYEELETFAKRLLKHLNQQEEVETTLQENIQKLPTITKQEIVESIATIKEVKGSENTSKAKAILGKIVEKLASSGITLAASWTAYFVLQNMGIDKATIDLFLEVYKNFSDSE